MVNNYYSLARSVVLSSRQDVFLYNKRLDDLLLQDYPFESPRELIVQTRRLVNLIDRELETLQAQLEDEKDQLLTDEGLCEDIIGSARINSQSIGALLSITRMIELSTREYTPQHAVMFVHR